MGSPPENQDKTMNVLRGQTGDNTCTILRPAATPSGTMGAGVTLGRGMAVVALRSAGCRPLDEEESRERSRGCSAGVQVVPSAVTPPHTTAAHLLPTSCHCTVCHSCHAPLPAALLPPSFPGSPAAAPTSYLLPTSQLSSSTQPPPCPLATLWPISRPSLSARPPSRPLSWLPAALWPGSRPSTPASPAPPCWPPWGCCRLSTSVKGLLLALLGGGLPAGFVGPFTRMAHEASSIPSLEILLVRCLFHLAFAWPLRCRRAPLLGPTAGRGRLLMHAVAGVVSIACAYTSFMAVPSGNATTVRKGSSTVGSAVLALCVGNHPLSRYDWFGLLGSTVGLLIMVVPDLMFLDSGSRLADAFGYIISCLGGVALALSLVIFRAMDIQCKLPTAAFAFGALGTLLCFPAVFLLQEPVLPADPLTWTCTVAVSLLAVISFLCASHAATLAHPALVCAVLHVEVVVTLVVQYYVLQEAVTPFDITGAGVILGSISIIALQSISCHPPDEEQGGEGS
ncbi:solute carrier family 35 member G5-like [Carettochelys insculpta]|uniref:solute carrier family 35 member G5-like n=1 Tax=Carettochelys insculpta TaxID=44489 RepID=UPI003EBBB7D1